jgi:hypothetical protein
MLNFTTRVIPSGKSFCSRLIAVVKVAAKRSSKFVFLNEEFHADIRWWIRNIKCKNGISIIAQSTWDSESTIHVECNAAGWWRGRFGLDPVFLVGKQMKWGGGHCCAGAGHCYHLLCHLGLPLQRKHIMFHSDNMAVVSAISARRVKGSRLMIWVEAPLFGDFTQHGNSCGPYPGGGECSCRSNFSG